MLKHLSTDTLLSALAKRKDVKDLITVSNNSGGLNSGVGTFLPLIYIRIIPTGTLHLDMLLNTNQVSKIIASYPGRQVVPSHPSFQLTILLTSTRTATRTSRTGSSLGRSRSSLSHKEH